LPETFEPFGIDFTAVPVPPVIVPVTMISEVPAGQTFFPPLGSPAYLSDAVLVPVLFHVTVAG
jgi:hypothetical protein